MYVWMNVCMYTYYKYPHFSIAWYGQWILLLANFWSWVGHLSALHGSIIWQVYTLYSSQTHEAVRFLNDRNPTRDFDYTFQCKQKLWPKIVFNCKMLWWTRAWRVWKQPIGSSVNINIHNDSAINYLWFFFFKAFLNTVQNSYLCTQH